MLKKMMQVVRDEEGATMVEYALLVSLISIAAVTVLLTIGPKILAAFTVADGAM